MIGLMLTGLMVQGTPAVTLGDIGMHLFYAETGRLSRDISPPNSFTAWNTIIGEGDAEENAQDLVVVVELRTRGEQNIEQPLSIVARNAAGRVIGQRRVTGGLSGENGRAYFMLHLPDVGCARALRVTATFAGQVRNEMLNLNCGE